MIPLVCGDPAQDQKPASYTRFILPFAYSPTLCGERQGLYVYKPSPPADIWRRNYLTAETAAVLFGRARWLELKGTEPPPGHIRRKAKTITVRVEPPRLVLFEWPAQPDVQAQDGPSDPLQIGFLIVEASFPLQQEPPDLDDLLAFNEKFRYWQRPYERHEDIAGYRDFLARHPSNIQGPSRLVRDAELSEIYFGRWASLLTFPIEDSAGKRWRLFPEAWERQAQSWVESEQQLWDSGWIVYTDSRAFVWTCAIVEQGGKALAEAFHTPTCEASAFGHWIKLLNVDEPGQTPDMTHKSTAFERDWARKRTYHRWEEQGTFYGFNYHCGAMLGPPLQTPPLWQHFGHMYFDQTLLLLYLRVGSFSFSRQLSRISAQVRDTTAADEKAGFDKWRQAFEHLRWDFAMFTNLYEFPLLSNQQQGVEMYEKARENMDVGQLFREIQEEIRSSHEYLEMQAGQEQTHMSTRLTVVATVGLAIGLATSFLGMNIIVDKSTGADRASEWGFFAISLVIFFFMLAFFISCTKYISPFFDWLTTLHLFDWLTTLHRSDSFQDKGSKP